MSDPIKPEGMSESQIREYAAKQFEKEQAELEEHNYNAIVVNSLLHFVQQNNWSKEDRLCVDVLCCQYSGVPSKQKLAELWNESFPGKMDAFMAKVQFHKSEFNQQLRTNLQKSRKHLDQLLSADSEFANVSHRTGTTTSSATSRKIEKMTLEEKVKIVADGFREVRIDQISLAVHEKNFSDKLKRLEALMQKYLDDNLEGAKNFVECKNVSIECLTAKLEYLETCIRSSTRPNFASFENKENYQLPEASEEDYKKIVVQNEDLERELEQMKKQEAILATLDPAKVQEYLKLHREHEYLSNLATGHTSIPNKSDTPMSISKNTSRLSERSDDRFSSTPFNSMLNRSSLNFTAASGISFSYEETPDFDETTK